jgi:hypothetical protein
MNTIKTIIGFLKMNFLAYLLLSSIGFTVSVAKAGIERFGLPYFYAVLAGSFLLTSILALVDYRFRKEESNEKGLCAMGSFRTINRALCILILYCMLVSAWFLVVNSG